MRLAPELGRPTAPRDTAQVLGAVSRRATLLGAAALGASLAAVYGVGAATLPSGHAALMAVLLGVAALQLAWVVVLLRIGAGVAVLGSGAALQLGLAVVWVLSRTAGLFGQSPLPVSEFDVLCLADELALAALAVGALRDRAPRSSLRALAPCQIAVTLAGATLFAWGGGHAHGAAVRASAAGVRFGAPAPTSYFCHLI